MAAVWERQPNETLKAYQAFVYYRNLPKRNRTLGAVAEHFGVHVNSIARWSPEHKYNWAERAAAFDEYNDNVAITVAQGSNGEAKQALMQQEGIENAALTHIATEAIKLIHESKELKQDMLSLTRLVGLIERIQTMRRRNIGLPTNYTTAYVEAEENEAPIYYAQPEVIDRASSAEEEE